jgi:hypothetical protein
MRGYLSKRWSFWIALFSCIAFLVGNMVGQHGWQAFWKSVWGREAIQFTGTVTPIAMVPDPDRWQGDNSLFSFGDVPDVLLIPLPVYRSEGGCLHEAERDRRVYSVRYLADNASGGEDCGSHFGVDIRVPKGTPVVAIANGIVAAVKHQSWGFGNVVSILHPNMPDPDHPGKFITLYSGYAHLGESSVSEGDIVTKGQNIGISGQTGLATGPHLHFQIERADASFHPYWPFDKREMNAYGLSFVEAVDRGIGRLRAVQYGVNPLLYVQQYQDWQAPRSTVALEGQPLSWVERMQARRDERRSTRMAHVEQRRLARLAARDIVPVATVTSVTPSTPGTIAHLTMLHDGAYDRGWEQLILYARDAEGNFVQGDVQFDGAAWLDAGFGEAEFSPATVTQESFDDRGRAIIQMLPQGQKTVIPIVRGAFEATGQPMKYEPSSTMSTQASRPLGSG